MVRNAVRYFLAVGITRGMPVLLLPLLARVLTVPQFGQLGLATVTVSVLAAIIGLNPHLFVISRYAILDRSRMAVFVFQMVLGVTGGLALVVVASPILAPLLSGYGLTVSALLLIALLAATRVLFALGLAVLQMERDAARFLRLSVYMATATAVLTAALLLGVRASWQNVLLAELLGTAWVVVVVLRHLRRQGLIRVRVDRAAWLQFCGFSLPLVPHVLGYWSLNFIDRFFIARYSTIEEVGLYTLAYNLSLGLSLVHEAAQRAWQPAFFEMLARGRPADHRRIVGASWAYYGASLVLGAGYWLVARMALPVVGGREYLPALRFLLPLVAAHTFLGMYRVVAGHFYHSGRTRVLAGTVVVTAGINIALNFLLVPRSGGYGAAVATLVAYAATFLILKTMVVFRSPLHWWTWYRRDPSPNESGAVGGA